MNFENNILQAQIRDHPIRIANAPEETKDGMSVPKAPARRKSSQNSVAQLKKSTLELDDRDKLNNSKPSPDFVLNKNNKLNRNIMNKKMPSKGDSDDYEDEGSDINWRPLRDFF